MPPTFLLVAAIIGTACLAPIVAVCAIVALAVPRLRGIGRTILGAGAGGAAIGLALDIVLNLVVRSAPGLDGLLIGAGFGFVSAGLGWPIWRWAREPLPELRPPPP